MLELLGQAEIAGAAKAAQDLLQAEDLLTLWKGIATVLAILLVAAAAQIASLIKQRDAERLQTIANLSGMVDKLGSKKEGDTRG